MSSIERSAFNSFTRGGQFLNHFFLMAKDNLVRYVMVAMMIGSPFGYLRYESVFDSHDRYMLLSEVVMITTTTAAPNTEKMVTLKRADGSTRAVPMRQRHNDEPWAHDVDLMWSDLKSVFWVTAGIAGLVLVLISIVAAAVGRALATDRHQRGARMERARAVRKTIMQYNTVEARKRGLDAHRPYTIANVPFPIRAETQHVSLVGSTGSGKTQLQATLLDQIVTRGDRAVVYDKMRSYVPRYYREGQDVILSPFDRRGLAWDMFADAREIADWEDIAAAMLPVKASSNDDFFTMTARSVFAHTANTYAEKCKAMVRSAMGDLGRSCTERDYLTHPLRPTMAGFLDVLMRASHNALKDYLGGTMAAGLIDPANERTTSSIRVTINNGVRSLGYLREPKAGEAGFSIRAYVRNEALVGGDSRPYDDTRVFMTSREDRHAVMTPLITTWVKIFNSAIMSQERASSSLVWVLLDELPSLHQVPGLTETLAEARQYNAAYLIGIQLVSQLRDIYGRDKAESIMGLTRNKVVFNPGDPNTAKTMSEYIGSRETLRREHSISIGASSLRDGQAVASRVQQETIILPEELAQLQPLHGVLKMSGNFSACKIRVEYQDLDAQNFWGDPAAPGLVEDLDAGKRCNRVFAPLVTTPEEEVDSEGGGFEETHTETAGVVPGNRAAWPTLGDEAPRSTPSEVTIDATHPGLDLNATEEAETSTQAIKPMPENDRLVRVRLLHRSWGALEEAISNTPSELPGEKTVALGEFAPIPILASQPAARWRGRKSAAAE